MSKQQFTGIGSTSTVHNKRIEHCQNYSTLPRSWPCSMTTTRVFLSKFVSGETLVSFIPFWQPRMFTNWDHEHHAQSL